MSNTIILERTVHLPGGTFGQLALPNSFTCATVELPWKYNKQMVSCIPEGTYTMKKRESGVVQRSTRKRYKQGWEITQVPNRSYIMVHPGNWPSNFNGCIGVGREILPMKDPGSDCFLGVNHSQATFSELMALLDYEEEWQIVISSAHTRTK